MYSIQMRRLSQKEVAEFFDVSTRTVRDWLSARCPVHTDAKTKYYIAAEVHVYWYIVERAITAARDDIPIDINDEEIKRAQRAKVIANAEREQAAAELAMLELARRLGDVVPPNFIK